MQSPARGELSENCDTAALMSRLNPSVSNVGERLLLNDMMLFATPTPSQSMMDWKNSASEAWWCGVSSVASPVSRMMISGRSSVFARGGVERRQSELKGAEDGD